MIGAQRLIINSLPNGAVKIISRKNDTSREYVWKILKGEVNPDTQLGRKIVEMAGGMAAREIFEFSWELKKRK